MGCSERQKEIKRRRNRKVKIKKLKKHVIKANASEKPVIANKLRALSPGAEAMIQELKLEDKS